MIRSLRRAYWWVMHRVSPRHRCHVAPTGLDPGYWDPDTVILHAAFTQLARYVAANGGAARMEAFAAELQRAAEGADGPGADLSSAHALDLSGVYARQAGELREAVALHRWWTVERVADRAEEDRLLDETFGSHVPAADRDAAWEAKNAALDAITAKCFSDEQAMLHRLVDLRPALWI